MLENGKHGSSQIRTEKQYGSLVDCIPIASIWGLEPFFDRFRRLLSNFVYGPGLLENFGRSGHGGVDFLVES